ncbi:hypothetical protein FPZ12_012710 [Amycolatopsis acidicola]|uniref:DUF3558 domain-containing protein n=1 Tax=Amycolatopsis acidicola TaxID=2596893 RepID=A0A5N0V9Z5_9PSEU|nr:hypothetical protein [Amycolatopsis acidicola]KAA9162093.1 hypothetical protein FPZ12_012710 [Amycolatopsis acidicola]
MARYWVAAVALLLTGCTNVVTGAASVDTADVQRYLDETAPLTSQRAFGDVNSVDYCTLLDLDGIGKSGATGVGKTSPSLSSCEVEAQISGQKVAVGLGFLESGGSDSSRVPDTSKKLDRGLTASKNAYNDYYSCISYLRFTDGVSIEIYVDNLADDPSPGVESAICDTDEAVLDGLVGKIEAKKVGHLTFGANSVGEVDACSLAGDPDVVAQIGAAEKTPKIPTKHRCRWQDHVNRNVLTVLLEIGPRPAGPTEQLGNHTTAVEAGSTTCLATTAIRPYPAGKNGEYELAEVYLIVRNGIADPCGPVRAVANVAFGKLPPG